VNLVPPSGPLRLLATATLVNTVGNGLFFTSAALFYTRSVGLTPGQVGLGLTIAGLLGLLVGIPSGHLADLRGAREVLVVVLVLEAAAMASFSLVHGFAGFLLASIAYVCLDKSSNAVRQGLIATAFAPEDRVPGRAYLRSITNLGFGVGSAFAGLAIAADTREAYVAIILTDALTYVGAALVMARLPRRQGMRSTGGGMLVALRDRPYVVMTAISGVLGLHYVMLEIAVPLWVDRYTSAPRSTVALLFVVNTVCCVLLQVRTSRGSHDVPSSARAQRTGGLLLAGSCVVFALSGEGPAAVAVAVLVLAALVNVAGELLQASGSWGLGFGLAPENAQGQYQGLYATGFAASSMLGPVVVTLTVIEWGIPGWFVMGALFVAAGVATVPAARWAERPKAVI
jgi:predicted MFS family arabinose efflux permease